MRSIMLSALSWASCSSSGAPAQPASHEIDRAGEDDAARRRQEDARLRRQGHANENPHAAEGRLRQEMHGGDEVAHSGTPPTGPREARPDDRLRGGPGIHHPCCGVWIAGSRPFGRARNDGYTNFGIGPRCGVGVGQIDETLVDIAPAPAFGRIVALDDRMAAGVEMLGGVPVRRVIAAADMAAGPAQPQSAPRTRRSSGIPRSRARSASPSRMPADMRASSLAHRCALRLRTAGGSIAALTPAPASASTAATARPA